MLKIIYQLSLTIFLTYVLLYCRESSPYGTFPVSSYNSDIDPGRGAYISSLFESISFFDDNNRENRCCCCCCLSRRCRLFDNGATNDADGDALSSTTTSRMKPNCDIVEKFLACIIVSKVLLCNCNDINNNDG